MNNEVARRIALVTGGSRGIGRACCRRLAEAGATVVVNYCTNEAAANETVQQIIDVGGRAVSVQADVSLEEDVNRMVGWVEQEVGPIDLLVNNAGVFDFLPHDQTTPEVWRHRHVVVMNRASGLKPNNVRAGQRSGRGSSRTTRACGHCSS